MQREIGILMKKVLGGIILLWSVLYAVCGCGVRVPGERILPRVETTDVSGDGPQLSSVPTPDPISGPESSGSPNLSASPEPPICPESPSSPNLSAGPEPPICPESSGSPNLSAGPESSSRPEPSGSPEPASSLQPDSPVYLIEYGEAATSIEALPSTEGYERYLTEDLCYREAYKDPEDGTEYWSFTICLPRFGENMPCHRELNAYFEELYALLLEKKEDFYDRAETVGKNDSRNWNEDYSYEGMTIGERYLTVYVINTGNSGGIRRNINPMPVTFNLSTGQPVTLPELLDCSEEEVRELVADYVYGYFLSQGDGYVWREKYLCYEPRDFYMLEQGLGVYYPIYAIECGAAGDFLFVIPYEALYENGNYEESKTEENT